MTYVLTKGGGLRERKKEETRQRIAETGLKLFIQRGYDGTTLDEIAAEAGIARRTFFYYFESKEAILLTFLDSFAKSIGPIVRAQSTDQTPLDAVRNSLLQQMASHENDKSIVVVRLLESTDALKARMQSVFVEMEYAVFEALSELWPQPQMRASLRMVSMASIGAMRVAKEAWRQDGGKRPLADYLQESFATLGEIA